MPFTIPGIGLGVGPRLHIRIEIAGARRVERRRRRRDEAAKQHRVKLGAVARVEEKVEEAAHKVRRVAGQHADVDRVHERVRDRARLHVQLVNVARPGCPLWGVGGGGGGGGVEGVGVLWVSRERERETLFPPKQTGQKKPTAKKKQTARGARGKKKTQQQQHARDTTHLCNRDARDEARKHPRAVGHLGARKHGDGVGVVGRVGHADELAVEHDRAADVAHAEPEWRIARLRYFNPVGAHESGLIGENPQGVPNNLMPYVAQVANGQREYLNVWGNDYPTPDGTGVRDYIHVVDLAEGHLAALDYLHCEGGLLTVNLGTGRGFSVLDMVGAFERACGQAIAYKIAARRPGDIAACWADPSRAQELLGWQAKRGLDQMCVDAWRWQQSISRGGGGSEV